MGACARNGPTNNGRPVWKATSSRLSLAAGWQTGQLLLAETLRITAEVLVDKAHLPVVGGPGAPPAVAGWLSTKCWAKHFIDG